MPDAGSLYHKITGWLLFFFSAFCQIDPLEYAKIREFERRKKAGLDPKAAVSTPRTHKPPIWPEMILWLYVYANIRFLSVLGWQYLYDYDFLKLKQIDAKLANLNSTSTLTPESSESAHEDISAMSELRDHYQRRYIDSRATLKRLGQPITDLHWMAPGFGSILVFLTFDTYMMYIILTRLGLLDRFDVYFIRMILSEEYESMRSQELVDNCVRRVRNSSENFVLNMVLRSHDIIQIVGSGLKIPGYARLRSQVKQSSLALGGKSLSSTLMSSRSGVESQLESHLLVCELLDELLRTRQLIPINRSREWVDRLSLQFALLATLNLVYSLIFDVASLYWIPAHFGYFHMDGYMDLLTYLEIWIIVEVSVFSITLYICLLQVNTTDQTKYMNFTIERVEQCVLDNDRVFAMQYRSDPEASIRAINGNLVKAILDYEVFVAQFKPVQRSFTFIARMTTSTALGVALSIRSHMMYAEMGHRFLGIYFFFVVVVFTDSLLLPLCAISNHSKRLHARMMSLLCQAIELNSKSGATRRLVCDEHLIWQLRNILMDPTKFMNNFVAYALPKLPMTATNIIKLHYWYLLLILSYYARIDSWKTVLGDLQDDPLHLLGDL